MEQQTQQVKQTPAVDLSLSRISYSMKELVIEMKAIKQILGSAALEGLKSGFKESPMPF